ncbi:unnamed protein product [Phytophthora lilii]|uniref:Unnamed protein product n=1 Tax=Phytophthora lilii TaxID=2077276 RepID=A0A9W6TTQ8_9STRA|nr:unnamed protein product [Phytophthora lilii]
MIKSEREQSTPNGNDAPYGQQGIESVPTQIIKIPNPDYTKFKIVTTDQAAPTKMPCTEGRPRYHLYPQCCGCVYARQVDVDKTQLYLSQDKPEARLSTDQQQH